MTPISNRWRQKEIAARLTPQNSRCYKAKTSNFSTSEFFNYILKFPLSNNKKYMIRDNFIVKYKNTTWKKYIKFLKKMGFKYKELDISGGL